MNKEIRELLVSAIQAAGYQIPVGFSVAEPPSPDMGDFATNVALMIAKQEQKNPRQVAEKIINNVRSEMIRKVEIAGPGFINLHLSKNYMDDAFAEILKCGKSYGKNLVGEGKSVNVEYISANPTGPVHIGNARGGPIGEALANLFDFCGYKVVRSFYVNDIGGQIDKLAETFYYWYEKLNGQEIEFPEGGYPGEFVKEATEKVVAKNQARLKSIKDKDDFVAFFKHEGVRAMIDRIKNEVDLIGIQFDDWIYQSELENNGNTEEVLETLKMRDSVEEREGAVWFKNPEDPDFKDQEAVLRKSDGRNTLTYFADDIACHKYKVSQGADLMVDVWGSNHHGHIARMKSAMQAIGIDPAKLHVILYQNVRIKNGDEIIKMSKRQGNFILLSDVINFGVGADAFKYFILNQNNNTPFDFDVKLAKEKSEKNPVFCVQYAYARISSILRKAKSSDWQKADISLLKHPREKALIRHLVKFPDLLDETLGDYQLQRLPHYVYNLSSLFHEFYNDCRIIGEKAEIEQARIALIQATKIVIKNVLTILDISTPEKM